MNKALKTVGNNKGFTLLEFVVVVALAAVVMVATAMLITKGKESAAFSSVKDNIQIIQAGLAERWVFSPKMPVVETM
ncbi:MAG TPA: prepilin-type N-terminal cleavage/methylation domain-containing protein, partial [Syntrophorhabdaceae bacterium]|nr:prepilin-type N-terminal cleavage/methylation domain-containing protein [Syntrophorhabdaceae bacterium]